MPGGSIAIIQTRWHMDDLTGRVVKDMSQNERADQYEVIEFPAILDVDDPDTGKPIQKPLWPEFFDIEALLRTKASMPVFQWNAQYQQQPTAEEAALVKREWWNEWEQERPPSCEYIIMSLDSAAEKHNRADFTALTTWGVFHNEETSAYNIILLNSIKERMEFHELKEMAMEQYTEWEPDAFIVEKKSSGVALYQEMRRMGLLVQEYTPHRGSGDKLARLNAVSDIVQSGLCWVPQTRWAEEVVEEIAGFPFMSHDDLVDSTVMALMRFRQGGFIRLPTDEPEDIKYFKRRGSGFY
jgi:predicted phage terminase large subunit-like protein